MNSTKGNLEEINIQSLSPGATYIFRVMARNRHGVGAASEALKITTKAELDVPEAVTKLEAQAKSSFSILVSWTKPNGFITKYKLYFRQVCIFSNMKLSTFFACVDVEEAIK